MSSYDSRNRIRLRISEITLQPSISERAIKAKLFVDGVLIKELPTIEKGHPLKWSSLNIIDASQTSRLELGLYERQYRKHSRYDSDSCLVSELEGVVTKILKIQGTQYSAELTILDQRQAEELFVKSRKKLAEMEQTSSGNQQFKNTQRIFKSMLEFGSAVAELNPIAKTVLAVCTRAWERLEEQQKSGEELDDLARGLAGMVPLVDEVKKYAQLESLRQMIEEFLHMIEDVSIFVLERKTKGFVVQVFRSVVDSSDRDQVEELVKRFQKTKSDFDTAIGVQTMAMVATADERELLKQLNPVEPIGHNPSRGCQDGTRLGVLGYIDDWIVDQNPSSSFMWIYGQAGIGKSTILTSVCNRLSEKGIPIVSFFCKRDDPALRDPLRLINSVAHGLACRYPPYGKRVAKAIDANSELCASHLRVRYEGLLKKPLNGVENVSPSPHFVLIDAMDECGSDDNRRQLIEYLLELSSLVPWLKVIVTSRPDSDIRSFFDQPNTVSVSRCDLQSYSAANDIRAFISVTLNDIAIRDEWPADGISRLCAKAGELFIWAATACKFIIKADDTQDRFRQLTDDNSSGGGFNGLDALYMAVISNSMADQADDSILNMRRCIGAIVIISMRQPVPIEVLCKIMQPYMKSGVLRTVVGRLGAVIYSDAHLAGAIRVLHPSFADFALDEARSNIFWVRPIERNIEISVGCMYTMEHELRFNICDLETSHLLNSEVPDLESKIEANISGQLAYSCVYWINHLVGCDDKAAAGLVANILDNPRLLYWLEVLSVLRRVDVALKELRELSQWLMSYRRDIAHYAWDAHRFVFAFSDPIIASAPHIYISALPLAPRQSAVSRRFLPLFPNTAVVKGGDETWPKWLRSIPLPGPLCLMRVSQDSQRLVVSTFESRDNQETISVFDLRTGGLLRVLERSSVKHQSEFVAISPDGSLVSSGSTCGGISFWDADIGALIYTVHIGDFEPSKIHYPKLRATAFSSDGNTYRLLTDDHNLFGSRNITIWEIEPRNGTKLLLLRMPKDSSMTNAVLSPDGAYFAVYFSRHLVIYSCYNAMNRVKINCNLIYSAKAIVFSPDGALIAAALNSQLYKVGCVQIWDTKTGACIAAFEEHLGEVSSLAFSSDGSQIVTHTSNGMRIWDTKACTTIGSPFGVDNPDFRFGAALLFFSPDNNYILSGSHNDARIRIWDISSISAPVDNDPDTAYTLHRSRPHYNAVKSLQVWFSPDGTRILSRLSNITLQTWDVQTGAPIGEALVAHSDAHYGGSLFAFSPDGNHLVAGGASSGEMVVRDMNTGSVIKKLSPGHDQTGPESIIFSFNGSHLFSIHGQLPWEVEKKVYIWDPSTYNLLGSWGIKVGNIDMLYRPTYLPYVHVHAVSPNATSLASSYGGKILIHDAHTGKITATLVNRIRRIVSCVAFSPNGTWIASEYGRGIIWLWEVTSGTVIDVFRHRDRCPFLSLAFSPDGTKLAASLGDIILVWDVSVNSASDPWRNDNASHWPSNAHCLPPHPIHSDWVSHDKESLTLWLPDRYRRDYEPRLLLRISEEPVVHIDFSKFVHGTNWTSVISEEALRSCRKPNAT